MMKLNILIEAREFSTGKHFRFFRKVQYKDGEVFWEGSQDMITWTQIPWGKYKNE